MRGNHDCFDLPSWQSHVNFYRTHGKSADLMEAGQGIYEWQLTPSYGKYRFVAIDAWYVYIRYMFCLLQKIFRVYVANL